MKGLRPVLVGLLLILVSSSPRADTILSSRHNLSVTGTGNVVASQESQVCIFCHTAHDASPQAPLWNRQSPGQVYQPYTSSTAVAAPGQPTGSSLLCLSCHDGTIAIGDVLSRPADIAMAGGTTVMPAGPSRIGTDLTHDHPISFQYTSSLAAQNGELADPATLRPELELDANGELQCTTCHDAHDDQYGQFLVWPNTRSQLCTECHAKVGWTTASHAVSNAVWNMLGADPWPASDEMTVSDNACGNCHLPHLSSGGPRLLAATAEEDVCSACHNGNVASEDIIAEFGKLSTHPVFDTTLVHDPSEPATITDRHVECVDCHNGHAARSDANPMLGALANVRGVDLAGSSVATATEIYQVCFRCHGDNPGTGLTSAPRQHAQLNVRLEFQPTNPSYHPVASPGVNPDVPSLIAPLTTASTISCTSCHDSDSAAAGGVSGPHGSIYEPLLVRRYETLDFTPESSSAYALCYACHSRSSILNDDSFGEHRKHIQGEDAPCNVCHDPHGVSATQGNSTNNSHLINFDISVVSPNNSNQLSFTDTGRFSGSCSLSCHGEQHNNENY